MSAGAHRADEDLGVEEVIGEPDPVAEKRTLGERARGIDRDHADLQLELARRARRARSLASICRRRAIL